MRLTDTLGALVKPVAVPLAALLGWAASASVAPAAPPGSPHTLALAGDIDGDT
ncbi:MAG: hypothetical protein QOI13_2270 [Paraburkholderia sp.]|nr:hypothetical protein [Paraburkholderia sp.]